ncbi:hypothetical protein VDGE_21390 [Verticillium dahliae]|uniref:Uncharacterized protein n=2 Tax=Verticillium TaxID=1036719 RepID=A0A444RT53_VERDA|nr:hypothetical protein VDGE_21390 [Verticillium dahliae]
MSAAAEAVAAAATAAAEAVREAAATVAVAAATPPPAPPAPAPAPAPEPEGAPEPAPVPDNGQFHNAVGYARILGLPFADLAVKPLGRKAMEEAVAIRQPGYIVHCQEADALDLALFSLDSEPYDQPLDGEDETKPVRGRTDIPFNPKLAALMEEALAGENPIRPRLQGARYPG